MNEIDTSSEYQQQTEVNMQRLMKRKWQIVIVFLFCLGLVNPVWASSPPISKGGGGGSTGAATEPAPTGSDEEHEKKGLLDIQTDLGIYSLVVFILLLLVLRKIAWGPMLQGLKKREESIRSALEDAQNAKKEAEELRARLQQEVDQAHLKVRDILDEARRDAQYTKDQIVQEGRAEIQTERERLHREIEMAKDQALQELWNQAVDLATLVSNKATRKSTTTQDHRRYIDEALNELQRAKKTIV